MRDREWRLFIGDMVGFCENVVAYTENLDNDTFIENQLAYDATMWNLRLIGEAATHVPSAVREANPNIEWSDIIGLRHHLTHAYLTVDNEIIWETIRTDIPQLLIDLRTLLDQTDSDNRTA